MNGDSGEDGEDMRRLQAGHDHALNDIMVRWKQPLANFLFRHTGSETAAIDLAQETFVRVYEHRRGYRGGRFSTWLFSIALNLARNHARWRKRHPAVSIEAEFESGREIADGRSDPACEAARADEAAVVRAAVLALPEDLRAALLLFEYEELSHAEIAAALGCTPKAVETRLYRARQILRESLIASDHAAFQ